MRFFILQLKRNIYRCIIAILLIAQIGCRNQERSEMENTVDSFATAYFNWDFERAKTFCSAHSRIWLTYASSNVLQSDIDTLQTLDEGAVCEILEINRVESDQATALIRVSHFLPMDSIGKTGKIQEDAVFALPLIREKDRWRVALSHLPYPEQE